MSQFHVGRIPWESPKPDSGEGQNIELPWPTVRPHITGRCFASYRNYSDIFRPQFRPYDTQPFVQVAGRLPQVEHDDISKTWLGASPAMAEELMFWEEVFRKHFEDHFQKQFYQHYTTISGAASGSQYATNRTVDIHCPVNLMEIAAAMIHRATLQGYKSSWFASHNNMSDMVIKFILTHDCFSSTTPTSSLRVGATVTLPDTRLETNDDSASQPKVEITSNPDYIRFDKPTDPVEEGKMVQLHPRYQSPSRAAAGCTQHVPERLTFQASVGWLHWDSQTSAFTGVVPPFDVLQSVSIRGGVELFARPRLPGDRLPPSRYEVQVVITALDERLISRKVRYRQTVRARARFTVHSRFQSPPEVQHQPRYAGSTVGQPHPPFNPGGPSVNPPSEWFSQLHLGREPNPAVRNFYSQPTRSQPPGYKTPARPIPVNIGANPQPRPNEEIYTSRGGPARGNLQLNTCLPDPPGWEGQSPNWQGASPASGTHHSARGSSPLILNPSATAYIPQMEQTRGADEGNDGSEAYKTDASNPFRPVWPSDNTNLFRPTGWSSRSFGGHSGTRN